MKIAVDGVKLSGKPCGLTNIAMSIIAGLAKTGEHDIYVLLKAEPYAETDAELKTLKNVTVIVRPPKLFKSVSIFWSLFCINGLVKDIAPDLFIAPNFLVSPWQFNSTIKTAVFVHDLIIKEYPETMHWFNRWHMRFLFKYSLKKAHILWCNSQYTSTRLMHFYKDTVRQKKIFCGSGIKDIENYSLNDETLPDEVNALKPYILYVGTVEPRKNIEFLIKLYEELYNKYNLVMIGGNGWGETARKVEHTLSAKPYLEKHITRRSNVSNSELRQFYRNAEFLISTSLNEGLGLPILEAMASGCPVITPKNSAFLEIVDGVEVTVPSWNVTDWLYGIDELTANKGKYIKNGFQKVQKYNWDYVIDLFLKYNQ